MRGRVLRARPNLSVTRFVTPIQAEVPRAKLPFFTRRLLDVHKPVRYAHAPHAQGDAPAPRRVAWYYLLYGLGSKLGLAPLYAWLPETYEAALTSTSALLAAVQFNESASSRCCACCRVFRGQDTGFVSQGLLIMGLSLTVAAVQVMATTSA